MRIELQPAYVLHTRPYRDTSLLVDFFTPSYGRVAAVARGVRKHKSRSRSLLNPFTRLLISLQGKADLKLLTAVEADHCTFHLQAERLYSGFYVNELLMRLLPEVDAQESLFDTYQASLGVLQNAEAIEPVLRDFELKLLTQLGYGLDFERDANTGEKIIVTENYRFDVHQGFIRSDVQIASVIKEVVPVVVSGVVIAAIAARDFSLIETRQVAKQLCRRMLAPLLGNKPLNSRNLFVQLK